MTVYLNRRCCVYVNNKEVKAKDFDEIASKCIHGRFVLDKYDEVVFALFEFDTDMVECGFRSK